MSWLAVSGVDFSSIAAAAEKVDEPRRDIGEVADATDGTHVPTWIARKHDINIPSIPLSVGDAFAWEGLAMGKGHHWNFDTNLYSSKGLGPSGSLNASQVVGTPKFGAGVLRVNVTTGTINFAGACAGLNGTMKDWTVLVWRFETAVWHHYIVTSAGKKWLDGVRNDGVSTTWLSVNGSTGDVVIANTTGVAQDYDDLVTLPYAIVDGWAPAWGTMSAAFSDLPYLNCVGTLVTEQATRQMHGASCVMTTFVAAPKAGGRQKDMKKLTIQLQEK